MTGKERIHAIIEGADYDRVAVTPVFNRWAAQFAGQCYRDYCVDPSVLVKSQIAVTFTFNVDQISVVSDPWTQTSAYGVQFDYPENEAPTPRQWLIKTPDDIDKLGKINIERAERMNARVLSVSKIARLVQEKYSILGWIEGPFEHYCCLRSLGGAIGDIENRPDMFLDAAEVIIENIIDYADAQIKAGADMIAINESDAAKLGEFYGNYVEPLERQVIEALHEKGVKVRLHIAGDTRNILPQIQKTGADVIDIDWKVPLAEAREIVGDNLTLAGNIAPADLQIQGRPDRAAGAAKECLKQGGKRLMLMPGCEVPRDVPQENVRSFCPCPGSMVFL
jgi:MtaA/CmuA family methyltransferase